MPSLRLAVLSFFRNSAHGQAQRFMDRVAMLRDAWPGELRMIAVWGDCDDNTVPVLLDKANEHRLDLQLVERSHGGPWFGSVESAERFKAMSWVGNGGLEQINEHDDVVLYSESDIKWEPVTIVWLAALLQPGVDVVAPLVFAGDCFYDVFAYRGSDGERFSPFYPYHRLLGHLAHQGLTEVNSVGSCFVMRGQVGRACRIINDQVLVGFGEDARAKGYHIFVDPSQSVKHI